MKRSKIFKSLASSSSKILRPLARTGTNTIPSPSNPKPPYDIFINHRGVDTKKNISSLLYQCISSLGYHPFLDRNSMKPGDKLFQTIERAINECRVGVAVFSPRYCESYFCLHELALMMESNKKVVPIFCDIKPSELQITNNGDRSIKELERFRNAVEEAKNTVGLTFDTINGDWSEFLTSATDVILQVLHEAEEDVGGYVAAYASCIAATDCEGHAATDVHTATDAYSQAHCKDGCLQDHVLDISELVRVC